MIFQIELDGDKHIYSENEYDALSNLAMAFREGKHILVIPPSAINLIKKDKIRDKEFSALRAAYRKSSEHLSLLKEVSSYIQVVISDNFATPTLTYTNSKTIRRVPLTYFKDSEKVQKTTLIGESEDDCTNYISLAQAYLRANKFPFKNAIQFRYRSQPGIGGNISPTTAKYVNGDLGLFLVISESDAKYPSQETLGSTAKGLVKIFNKECPWGALHIINANEIENLAPWCVIEKAIKKNTNIKNSHIYQHFYSDAKSNYWLYLDLKEGLSLQRFNSLPTDVRNSFSTVFKNLGMLDATSNCPVFSGIGGDNIRHSVNEFFQEAVRSPNIITEQLRDDQLKIIDAVFIHILSWFCALKPIRL